MNGDVFEYGGHRFQPYAKYKADYDSLEPYFTNNFNFIHTKYNREDFFNKSPVKCCDVFYCLDDDKFYYPSKNRLVEFCEPPIAEFCKARMVNDYEIIHSIYVGEREVIVGEDKNAEYRYFCGYYESNDIFARAVDCKMSNDYLEIMNIYCNRAKEQVELFKSKQIEGAKLITSDMCSPCNSNDDLIKKIAVLKPDCLRREYQNEYSQLVYVTGGKGAKPNSIGTKIYGYILGKKGKSETYFRRYDIMGIMDKDNLPEWAVKSLAKIKTDIHREER